MRVPGLRRNIRVFISYRRTDTGAQAGRLYDALTARYGDDAVFMDTDTIRPGEDFRDVLGEAVGRCDVLVAVIGSGWLAAADGEGARRLDDPDDWVRIEIESALGQGVRVIPALIDGTAPPAAEELPETLEPLAHRQAISLSSGSSHWRYDVSRLATAIERPRGQGRGARRWSKRRPLLAGAAVVMAGAVVLGLVFLVLPSPAALGTPGDIAFTRNDGIYRMRADGTGVKRMYQTGRAVSSPAWSPDAKRIAFAMDGDIWLIGSSGPPKDLTGNGALKASSPAWSPDGKEIAFAAAGASADGRSGLGVVSSSGGDVRMLLADNEFDGTPSWSPDGRQIIFSTARDPLASQRTRSLLFMRSLYLLRVSDGSLTPLVYTSADSTKGISIDDPDWSGDGKTIVFTTTAGAGCTGGCIDTYRFSDRSFHTLAVPPASSGLFDGYSHPRWADNKQVVFSYQSKLWKVSTEGGVPQQIGTDTDIFGPSVARPPVGSRS